MREHLYRGKLNHSKEWVQGSLIISQLGNPYIYPNEIIEQDGHHIRFDSDAPFFVIPETVGQYIGLLDKNGAKIFDNDIVKFRGKIYLVSWHDKFACFAIFIPNDLDSGLKICDAKECEIIGNATDNPELLEGIK